MGRHKINAAARERMAEAGRKNLEAWRKKAEGDVAAEVEFKYFLSRLSKLGFEILK